MPCKHDSTDVALHALSCDEANESTGKSQLDIFEAASVMYMEGMMQYRHDSVTLMLHVMMANATVLQKGKTCGMNWLTHQLLLRKDCHQGIQRHHS